MVSRKQLLVSFILVFYVFSAVKTETVVEEDATVEEEPVKVDDEKLDYARGSVCGYCAYCKFCKLCDEDCPCEPSPLQPNCKMCKYCKYCYLCSAACNTFCKPGGIVDKISAAIITSLPFHDKVEIKKDINSMKKWIDKSKDEL